MGNLKKIIVGNWKMNLNFHEAMELVKEISQGEEVAGSENEIIVAPPYLYLHPISEYLKHQPSKVKVAAQDVHYQANGAFTGKISCSMLADLGVNFSIIGHSEQRQHFHETDENVQRKAVQLLQHNLVPILCVGETLEERESNQLEKVIKNQVQKAFKEMKSEQAQRVILAYEPVWAIGTGKSSSGEDADEAHRFIRSCLESLYDGETAESIPILYGGSVKASNVKSFYEKKNIDGVLVGGASLKADEFLKIIALSNSDK